MAWNCEHITIKIRTIDAAMTDSPGAELARILRKLANKAESEGELPVKIMDSNGNTIGIITG
jgi:hypothetical protein